MNITNEKGGTRILTKILETVFNTDGHYLTEPPAHEESTKMPFPKQPTIRPVTKATTEGQNQNLLQKWFKMVRAYPEPDNERTTARTTTRPPTETTTLSSYQKWRKWFNKEFAYKLHHERTTIRPLWTKTVGYERTTIRPYVRPFRDRTTERAKIEHPLIIQSGSSFGLENCLWVALGGVGVLILMAIFMKLGQPIRRVRRQLSNNRPAPDAITVPLDLDYSNLDMSFLLRSGDRAASPEPAPMYDPPPPYAQCAGSCSSINKFDSEEPPPRYSATFENFKHAEPQVHIQIQNADYGQND